jgi:hypothetical protein
VAVALLLAACSSPSHGPGPQVGGPLQSSEVSYRLCLPAAASHKATIGLDVLRNDSGRVVTVRGVALRRPKGLRLERALLVPFQNGATLVGNISGFPPPGIDKRPEWHQRTEARNAEIPSSAQIWNLVLEVGVPDGRGTADGVDVVYRSGDTTYLWKNSTAFDVRAAPHTCF